MIREVSLVMAGANSGAFIDNVMAHSEDGEPLSFIFCVDDDDYICHAAEEMPEYNETLGDIFDTMTDKQQMAVYEMLNLVAENNELSHAEEDYDEEDEEMAGNDSYEDILGTLNDDQMEAVSALIDAVADNVANNVADAYEDAYDEEEYDEDYVDEECFGEDENFDEDYED